MSKFYVKACSKCYYAQEQKDGTFICTNVAKFGYEKKLEEVLAFCYHYKPSENKKD